MGETPAQHFERHRRTAAHRVAYGAGATQSRWRIPGRNTESFHVFGTFPEPFDHLSRRMCSARIIYGRHFVTDARLSVWHALKSFVTPP